VRRLLGSAAKQRPHSPRLSSLKTRRRRRSDGFHPDRKLLEAKGVEVGGEGGDDAAQREEREHSRLPSEHKRARSGPPNTKISSEAPLCSASSAASRCSAARDSCVRTTPSRSRDCHDSEQQIRLHQSSPNSRRRDSDARETPSVTRP